MKAIRVTELGGPEVLQPATVDDPVAGPGEILIRVEAAGVNFIEVYYRKGLYSTPLPFTPGSEGAGIVAAVGAGVESLHVGDRVVTQNFRGSYAELATAPADKVIQIPDGVSTKLAGKHIKRGVFRFEFLSLLFRQVGLSTAGQCLTKLGQ